MSTTGLPHVWPTVVHMLWDAARCAPDHPALVCDEVSLTYEEYANAAGRLAQALVASGAGPGGRVATLMDNSAEAAVAIYGVLAAGAQVVPLNPRYTAAELAPILADAEPSAILYDDALEPLVAAAGAAALVRLPVGLGGSDDPRAGKSGAEPVRPGPADLAILQYTGGTTGRAKGVDLTHGAVSVNLSQREVPLPSAPGDRVLVITPLFHSYATAMGLFLAPYRRGTLYISRRFDAAATLRSIAQHRISFFSASPAALKAILREPGFAAADFSSLRVCSSGSAPLDADTLQQWEDVTGCPICEGYGQTEAGPVLTFNPATGPRRPGGVGPPLPETEISIVDTEAGEREMPVGEAGEIRARGPQVMRGYSGQPAETAKALRGGWLYTGDIGRVDAEGYLEICDRKKDMVVTAGYNVYPREVEDALRMHQGIGDAAVVGVADERRGEMLVAFVVAQGEGLRAAMVMEHIEGRLAKYKWPRDIVFIESLPRTSVGKIDKVRLRALAAGSSAPLQEPDEG